MFRRSSLFILAPLSAVVALLLTLSPAGATPSHHTVRDTKGACHVTAHITRLGNVRTKYSATRTERVTVTTRGTACARAQLAQLGTHRRVGCDIHAAIEYRPSVSQLHGAAWTDSCNGALVCFQTAELQQESPTDPGTWFTIKEAAQTSGCIQADESKTNKDCHPQLVTFTYRTLGIFVIYWDDGSTTPMTTTRTL